MVILCLRYFLISVLIVLSVLHSYKTITSLCKKWNTNTKTDTNTNANSDTFSLLEKTNGSRRRKSNESKGGTDKEPQHVDLADDFNEHDDGGKGMTAYKCKIVLIFKSTCFELPPVSTSQHSILLRFGCKIWEIPLSILMLKIKKESKIICCYAWTILRKYCSSVWFCFVVNWPSCMNC